MDHGQQQKIGFWRGVFSDDGEPSSSRIFTAFLVLVVSGLLAGVVYHVCHLTEPTILGLWLTALPYLVGVMIAFMTALYFVNRGSGTFSDLLSLFRKQ